MSPLVSLLISSLVLAVDAAPVALNPTFNTLLSRDLGRASNRQRDVPGIIWSCLATTAACTYFAVHPNIPNPGSRTPEVKMQQLLLAFYAFIAPEVVILWAMRQRRAAYNIKEVMNKREWDKGQNGDKQQENVGGGAGEGGPDMSGDSKTQSHDVECTCEPESDRSEEWSMTHSFFLQMGGFMIKDDDRTYRVLTLKELEELKLELQVSEQEIKDRSKGDLIAKVITVGQTWWFVAQCCARFAQGLDVSIPELTTLAFAALNALTWFMWRNKPLHVRLPIYVDKDGKRISGPDFEDMRSERRKKHRRDFWYWLRTKKSCTQSSKVEPNWKKNEEWKASDAEESPNLSLLERLRRPLLEMIGTEPDDSAAQDSVCFPRRETMTELPGHKVKYYYMENVPRFYVSSIKKEDWRPMLLLSATIGIAFGAIHCVIWAPIFHFPTQVERLMWEVSALVITGIPLALFLSFSSHFVYEWVGRQLDIDMRREKQPQGHINDSGAAKKEPWYKNLFRFERQIFAFFITVMRYVGTIIYILARLILLGLAISSLRDLTPSTYETVKWTNFIPHI
ncbi:hypothetical protein AX16_003048 [Volvariella volvacea WC 439]|nr:hypothetical protein AX16_003048 [Volvariella volvacea WC 439]